MTRIGLISDTHGHLDERIFKYFADCDEIWHAGDIGSLDVTDKLEAFKTTRAVYGNIDGAEIRRVWPEHQRFNCEKVSIWMTHIGGYPGRYSKNIRAQLADDPPTIFVCGHSHILKVMRDPTTGTLHMNPGAAGVSGFHKVKTVLRFSIDGKAIENLEVIELGTRG